MLGIAQSAKLTQSELKEQYLRLAKEHHPDSGGDETSVCHICSGRVAVICLCSWLLHGQSVHNA